MVKRYRVTLTAEERAALAGMIGSGKAAARKLAHARVLLKADEAAGGPGWGDAEIAEAVDVGPVTVGRVRQRFVEDGLAAALVPRPTTRTYARALDGAGAAGGAGLHEAAGRAQAVDADPARRPAGGAGRGRVADVRGRPPGAEKNELKPWLREMWCIPPDHDCEFVAAMEDVLAVYARPYDARFPQLCLDEAGKQLIGEVRPPLPPAPGRVERYDCEYVRNGTANLFIAFEPLAGWRHVAATGTRTRTRADFAAFVRGVLDGQYREAEKVVLVMDQLNTHSAGSFYEAFPPAEARRLADRLEIHYTPKHGSWLNMAELELSALGRQCLGERIDNEPTLVREVAAWEADRNQRKVKANWRFTTADARVKLKRLYPSIHA